MSGICQANKNCGKKCTFKAKKEYGNIYCGVHKIYYQVVEAKAAAAEPSPAAAEPAPAAGEPVPAASDVGYVVAHITSGEPVVGVVEGKLTVKFNKEQAIAHFKKIHYGDLPCYMEPLYVCMRRAREIMDDKQFEIFEKNPRANVHIEERHMEEYMAYRRGINFYYEAIEKGYLNVREKHIKIFIEQFYRSLDGRLKKIEDNL
jgi:hypothetical protein